MRSIERVFLNIQESFPNWSSYICFAEAVRGRKFRRPSLVKWFYRLVEKDDYAIRGHRQIIERLMMLTKEKPKVQLGEYRHL